MENRDWEDKVGSTWLRAMVGIYSPATQIHGNALLDVYAPR